jgi:hypothetical protein
MLSRIIALAIAFVALGLSSPHSRAAAPVIQSISPAPGSTISSLSQVTVTFNVPVVGVQPGDLQINDAPAVARAGAGATATFQFSQPAPGMVAVNIDPDAVISDQAGNLYDPLASGNSWTYMLADTIVPTVGTAEPAPGAVISALTQIEVAFKEPVTGVDAADLQVNGVAATGLTVLAPDRYRFAVNQPAAGTVNVSFVGGHGIRDLAVVPNNFPGGSWIYTLNPSATADVVINEILADNRTSLQDENGQRQDWIELRNRGSGPVTLTGWALTDDPAVPNRWVFPNLTLNAGQYLIVFASGKDRATSVAGMTNHTNFRLSPGGGYLGLFNANYPRAAVHQLTAYPEQRADISYGLTAAGLATHFTSMTPRAANNEATAVTGFAQPPHVSVSSGFFNQPFNLALATETPGAEIRYSLDGSFPTVTNELYTGPISVAGTPTKAVVMVRAAAFRAGYAPSAVTTRTYIFPDHVLTQPANPAGFPSLWDSPCTIGSNCADTPGDYEMDPQVITNAADNSAVLARQGLVSIPTLSIVTDVNLLFGPAQGAYVRRESDNVQPVSAEYILPDGTTGFQQDCGFEIQGQTSPTDSGGNWKSKKLSMRLIFKGAYGPSKLHYRLFEDSPVEEFDTLIVSAGHNMYWNYMPNDDQRLRAVYVRDQYVADLQNALGGLSHHGRWVQVYLNGLYWGLHQLHERTDDSFVASYYGGSKTDYDVIKHDANTVVSGSSATLSAVYATARSGSVGGVMNNSVYETIQQTLDVPDFINYMIINYWVGNEDWAHKNYYASHPRAPGGRWRYHAWDSEHVLKGATYDNTTKNDSGGPTEMFNLLRNNAEFRLLFADQVHKHFFNGGVFYTDTNNPVYNPAFPERNRPAAMFMKALAEIDTAIVCESARWGDVGSTRLSNPLTRNRDLFDERDSLLGVRNVAGHTANLFPQRTSVVLAQFRTARVYPTNMPPAFRQQGGNIPAGYSLFLTNLSPGSTIYYTTNGTDPRVYGSSAVAPSASSYAGGPISLGATTVVKTRSLQGSSWSALNEATFTVAELASPLRLTEIMYNPLGGDAYEFIELKNTGSRLVDLDNYSFEGITYSFGPGTSIGAGATLVLANNANPASFAARYPGVIVAGYFGGSLANGGERIALKNGAGLTVTSVTYRDSGGWPLAADGGGASLEMIDPDRASSDPANWQASAGVNGTPGQINSTPPASAIVLSEVAAENLSAVNNGGTFPDWIELGNTTGTDLSLEGWSLSDDGNARKYVFPAGVTIPANGYRVVWCDAITNTTPGLHAGLGLDRDGDNVFLYNAQGQRMDAIGFGAQVANLTVARVNGAWTLAQPTPGAPNTAAAVAAPSQLSINEWLADAAPGSDDWIELYNRSTSLPVSLQGIYLGAGGTTFQIRSLSFVGPNGFVQLLADEGGGDNHLDFKLPATGAEISLYDVNAVLVEKVTYGAQVQAVSQGRLPDGSGSIASFPGSVSPGASNYLSSALGPILNELLARNDSAVAPWGTYADWIELANPTASPINLSGMSLSDSAGGFGEWIVPSGTTLPANGYLRIWCDDTRPASLAGGADLNTGFGLSSESGGVYFFGAGGQLVDSVEYGFQIADRSIGRSGGSWRLLAAPTPNAANSAVATLGSSTALRLNEWMAETLSGDDWFEVFNPGTQPVDLTGLRLTDDPSIYGTTKHVVAPLSFVGAGGFVVFLADGNLDQGRQHVSFQLDQLGEVLRIYTASLTLIDSVDVLPLPAGVSAGRFPDGTGAMATFYSTPSRGEPNYLPVPGLVINEVLTHTDPPLEDSVELFNPTAQAVSVGGYYLSDSVHDLKKYRLTAGASVGAGVFLVLGESQFNSGAPGSFALSSTRGGTVYLSAADGSGNLTGYRLAFPFGPQVNGVSFGQVATSIGPDYAALSARSLGAPNGAVRVGPVVINEVQYHPIDGVENAELPEQEFIELHNLSPVAVSLFDAAHPTNTWRLSGAVEFAFPGGVSLPSRGYALVVAFDPADGAAAASFRTKYGVALSVPLFGPFDGRLGNSGDEVVLEMPDIPQGPGPDEGYVPFVVLDHLPYGINAPWPTDANGSGPSLQRRRTYAYGNDPVNWKGAAPTAGRANVPGSTFLDTDQDGLPDAWETAHGLNAGDASDAQLDGDGDGHSNYEEYLDGTDLASATSRLDAPVVTSQPADLDSTAGAIVSLTVTASGTGPLQYQWSKNGFPIPGATSATLSLGPLSSSDAASYSATVWNGAGFATSRSARLRTLIPPRITLQPVGLVVLPGSNVTFTVGATGSGLIRYQWQLDGQDLPGATSPTLAINNAQLANEGEYVAVVTDDSASLRSAGARLIVKVAPVITVQPQPSTNLVGSSITFTVTATGSIPMGFQWRRNNTPVTNYLLLSRTSTYTLSNLTLADSASYRVVVTNYAGGGVASPQVPLLVVEPVNITSQPQSLTVDAGAPASFSVTATGTAPLRYQWSRDNVPLADATNATYSIAAVQSAEQGSYRVLVSNPGSSANSAPATLTVAGALRLSDLVVLPNGQVRLNISGAPNRSYFIEGSSNLSNWTTLGSIAYTNGLMPYLDATAPGISNRFYRARE